MARAAALPQAQVPRRCTAITSSNSAALMRESERSRVIPALFTSRPIPPYFPTQAWTSSSQNAGSATDPAQAIASPPRSRIAAAADSAVAGSVPFTTTEAPAAASASAKARPSPRDDPVTTAGGTLRSGPGWTFICYRPGWHEPGWRHPERDAPGCTRPGQRRLWPGFGRRRRHRPRF